MNKIAIYGAGGLGREVLTIIRSVNEVSPLFEFIGFFDDYSKSEGILGIGEDINGVDEDLSLVVAVGDPYVKSRLVSKIHNPGISFPKLIHPSVIMGNKDSVQMGPGVIVGAGSVLTLDIELGEHVLINLNCTIGHDVTIAGYSSVMPGVNIAGNVSVGSGSFLGAGVNIINNISVGSEAVIGAGAVVISDVGSRCTAVGVPARVIKSNL